MAIVRWEALTSLPAGRGGGGKVTSLLKSPVAGPADGAAEDPGRGGSVTSDRMSPRGGGGNVMSLEWSSAAAGAGSVGASVGFVCVASSFSTMVASSWRAPVWGSGGMATRAEEERDLFGFDGNHRIELGLRLRESRLRLEL